MTNARGAAGSRLTDRFETVRRDLDLLQQEVAQIAAVGEDAEARSGDPAALHRAAVRALAERHGIADILEPKIFSDPATNILLGVYIMEHEGQQPTTGACCAAAVVPRTTALRYIGLLGSLGYLMSEANEDDRRKTILRLSPTARDSLEQWLMTIGTHA